MTSLSVLLAGTPPEEKFMRIGKLACAIIADMEMSDDVRTDLTEGITEKEIMLVSLFYTTVCKLIFAYWPDGPDTVMADVITTGRAP